MSSPSVHVGQQSARSGAAPSPTTARGPANPQLVISPATASVGPVELEATPAVIPPERRFQPSPPSAANHAAIASVGNSSVETNARKRRDTLILERRGDPAVLVDIPQTPRPDELEISAGSPA